MFLKITGRLRKEKIFLEMKTIVIEIVNWWLKQKTRHNWKEISELEGKELRHPEHEKFKIHKREKKKF